MNFLSEKCLAAYWKQYPKESCARGEPGEAVFIEANGRTYTQPDDETEESFLDRLKRSEDQGTNLFHVEWPEADDKRENNHAAPAL